jgi:hypothetical protein
VNVFLFVAFHPVHLGCKLISRTPNFGLPSLERAVEFGF